jgi:hypothetical protein
VCLSQPLLGRGSFLPQAFWFTSSCRFTYIPVLQAGRSQVRFPMVSLDIFIDIILQAHYGPGVDSASDRNEYQEYILGVESAGAWG